MAKQESLAENALTGGPLVPSLLKFTVPFLLSTLLQTLYGTVDTLVIGNFGSTAGVSAVATGAQALSLVTWFIFGLSGGSTVLLGQYVGAKDEKRAAGIVGNTVIDFTALSIFTTVLMLFFYPLVLRLLNVPPEAMEEARRYMIVCTLGIPLINGYNIVSAILRSIGDSKSPLLFVAVACVVNIAGDLLLTGVFHMGALGVAIATVAAQGVSFVFSLVFLMRKGLPFAFCRKDIRFEKHTTRTIAKVGVPMGVQSILVNLSFLFITSIINSMGVLASAAMGIGDKVIGFAFLPQNAFSAAVSVVVAQNVGAGKPKRAVKATSVSIWICVAIEALFCFVCQVFPGFFPGLFTKDGEVIRLAGLYMKAYSIDGILTAILFSLSGYLNGNRCTTFNMIQNLTSTFLGRIPATWLFSRLPNTNLFLIGLAAPSSTVISLVMIAVFLKVRKNRMNYFPATEED